MARSNASCLLKEKVVLVDDEECLCLFLRENLKKDGIEAVSFREAFPVLTHLSKEWEGVVVTDVKMPGMDGLAFLSRVMAVDPQLPVILITGHGDIPMVVEAMRSGAFDFLEKPFSYESFSQVVTQALERRRQVLGRRRGAAPAHEMSDAPLVGRSAWTVQLRQALDKMADVDADVLLVGETGTGKEQVARCLHNQSPRAQNRFVAVNCCAIPEEILESELFGHEPGAFTGALRRRVGKFEYAHHGTIYLDEIDSMPLHLQGKLLRVLQERSLERLGSNKTLPVDIRVIASTKVDLKTASEEGRFREDLYYRLNVVTFLLPPLRERKEDIPDLFRHFVLQACRRHNRRIPPIEADLIRTLIEMDWLGNVREVKNAAERFVLGYGEDALTLHPFSDDPLFQPSSSGGKNLVEQIQAYEKSIIVQELARTRGNVKAAYTTLGLPRKTFYDKMRKYSLKRKDFQNPSQD